MERSRGVDSDEAARRVLTTRQRPSFVVQSKIKYNNFVFVTEDFHVYGSVVFHNNKELACGRKKTYLGKKSFHKMECHSGTMQCAKLHLQDRSKTKSVKSERPRRICQKRMVDPGHEEDPRWNDTMFHCNNDVDIKESYEANRSQSGNDLVLSVQNLQFCGNIEQKIRPRTGFKYKSLNDHQKHRMFVKEVVEDLDQNNADCSSELSNYFDNYAKYFMNNESSRASSSKSSVILYDSTNKHTENKAIQVDMGHSQMKKKHKFELKPKKTQKNTVHPSENNIKDIEDDNNDTKIAFYKNGKRKSLTIARNESPATVQIIRVDVVCNYSCSSTISDYEECKKSPYKEMNKENQTSNLKSPDNRYMLTNSVKTLDENISSGKVTLMCKTFKLTERSKNIYNKNNKTCFDRLTQVRV